MLGAVVGYILSLQLLDAALQPACDRGALAGFGAGDQCQLVALTPLEPFTVRIKIALLFGLLAGGPVIFYQLWMFITPGLTTKERRLSLPFVVFSQIMFAAGITFAWFVIPQGLGVLASFGGDQIQTTLTATNYLSFFMRVSLAFGVVFEIPLLLIFLSLVGVVTVEFLTTYRRHAIVANVVAAAFLTPTGDPLNLAIMAVPMILFYEISVLAARLIERRRRRRAT